MKKVYLIMDKGEIHLAYRSKKEAEVFVEYCNRVHNSGYKILLLKVH